MYKQEDIMKEEECPEDECDVCALHDKAYEFFKEKMGMLDDYDRHDICPVCNEILSNDAYGYGGKVVVGGHNGYTTDESIGYYTVKYCEKCKQEYAMMPIPVIYNGSHDIFYTGGNRFLTHKDSDKILEMTKEKIRGLAENFTQRIRKGEKLEAWNLACWCEGTLSEALSKFLYEKGLKK